MTTQNRHPSASSCHFPSSVSMKPSERTRALTRRGPFTIDRTMKAVTSRRVRLRCQCSKKNRNSELPLGPTESLPTFHDRLRHKSSKVVAKISLQRCRALHPPHGMKNAIHLPFPVTPQNPVKPCAQWKTHVKALGPAPILPFRDQK